MEMLCDICKDLWIFVVILLSLILSYGHCERHSFVNQSINTKYENVSSVSEISCLSRGSNCSLCLSDGNCGFCDTCKDVCHKPGVAEKNATCLNCAKCIPGTLGGPKKGHECRVEWWVS